MSPEAIKDKYEPRILAVLNHITEALRRAGYKVNDPVDLSADHYQWSLLVHPEEGEDIDISFTIAGSEEYDGEENGVNFMLDIVECGSRILGGLTPFNYTERCWDRDDDAAVEARFAIFELADPDDIVPILENANA